MHAPAPLFHEMLFNQFVFYSLPYSLTNVQKKYAINFMKHIYANFHCSNEHYQ